MDRQQILDNFRVMARHIAGLAPDPGAFARWSEAERLVVRGLLAAHIEAGLFRLDKTGAPVLAPCPPNRAKVREFLRQQFRQTADDFDDFPDDSVTDKFIESLWPTA
jgi:hypothetical protein